METRVAYKFYTGQRKRDLEYIDSTHASNLGLFHMVNKLNWNKNIGRTQLGFLVQMGNSEVCESPKGSLSTEILLLSFIHHYWVKDLSFYHLLLGVQHYDQVSINVSPHSEACSSRI